MAAFRQPVQQALDGITQIDPLDDIALALGDLPQAVADEDGDVSRDDYPSASR